MASAFSCSAAAADPVGPWQGAWTPRPVLADPEEAHLSLAARWFASLAPTFDGLGSELGLHYAVTPRFDLFAATALKRRRPADNGVPERYATAGATLRNVNGWTAKLFVAWVSPGVVGADEALQLRASSSVSAQFTRRLTRHSRLSVEVFNVLDQRPTAGALAEAHAWRQPGALDTWFFQSADRGLRVRLRATF